MTVAVDSSTIDAAILATLGADMTLLSYAPDGVWWDEAPANSKRFVIVSLMDSFDEGVFVDGRAIESCLYLVKAVGNSRANPNMRAAAARIDELLEDQALGVGSPGVALTGYTWMSTVREQRIRTTEVDADDPSISWFHRGGLYRIEVSVNSNMWSP